MTTKSTHPDAAELARVAELIESESEPSGPPSDYEEAQAFLAHATGELVDPEAFFDFTRERVGVWLMEIPVVTMLQNLPDVLQAAYMDAFLTGARFAQERAK